MRIAAFFIIVFFVSVSVIDTVYADAPIAVQATELSAAFRRAADAVMPAVISLRDLEMQAIESASRRQQNECRRGTRYFFEDVVQQIESNGTQIGVMT